MILHFQPAASAEPLEEPGVGFAPWANSDEAEGMNTSLVYVELKWADWEPERGVYDTEYVNEEFRLEEYRAQNRQVVFRFVCDEPTEVEHMDIPQWLYDEINGDGDWYSTSYGKGFSPNYANETIIEAHKNAITALGAQYGKDNFYISFSGGRDSCVLSALTQMALGDEDARPVSRSGIVARPRAAQALRSCERMDRGEDGRDQAHVTCDTEG